MRRFDSYALALNSIVNGSDSTDPSLFDLELEIKTVAHTENYPRSESFPPLRGDVNKDGRVDVNDATLVQKYVAKLSDFDLVQKYAANTLRTEAALQKIDISDVTRIQKYIAKLIDSF